MPFWLGYPQTSAITSPTVPAIGALLSACETSHRELVGAVLGDLFGLAPAFAESVGGITGLSTEHPFGRPPKDGPGHNGPAADHVIAADFKPAGRSA